MSDQKRQRGPVGAVLFAIFLIVVLVVGWHLLFPLMGAAFAATGSVWGVMVASIVILCVAILLLFVFTGMAVFVLGGVAIIWTIIAIVLFPILFPLLAPIIIILMLIGLLRR